jgi:hypothetical protein
LPIWNDLTDLLCWPVSPSWADDSNISSSPNIPDPPLINVIHRLLEWYVGLQSHEYVAVTLWALHTHIYDRFAVTPRLALTSPVRGCGKTTLLMLLDKLAAKPMKADAISSAAIYHSVDREHPTLLIDEADNLDFAFAGRLRAVFNSGHRKGGNVTLLDRGHPRSYSTFSPLAVAGIGTFPLPLMHRSVVIPMQRHDGRVALKRFDEEDCDELNYAYQESCLWARTVALERNPKMPPQLRNRAADNWRVLIAIADSFGPEWSQKAQVAALEFARSHQDEDAAVVLLSDIRGIFDARRVDRLPSVTLVAALVDMADAMWCEWRGLRGDQQPRRLSQGELARLLRPFGISPRVIWPANRVPGTKSARGYYRRGGMDGLLRRRHTVTVQQHQEFACRPSLFGRLSAAIGEIISSNPRGAGYDRRRSLIKG